MQCTTSTPAPVQFFSPLLQPSTAPKGWISPTLEITGSVYTGKRQINLQWKPANMMDI
ncbi:hypothetical protein T02_2872 [Trichinella nativa]|uniref:Uncharacterized protein n=1 Tax=Trichinella nativa TaxID=6335 RepID=A0A0V1KYT2_9BILA|nr:hypothetical protein T02_6222 [Trichinella nativa]KRZ52477.1 hypothetical protein T02_2872 [Trichinella nativa]